MRRLLPLLTAASLAAQSQEPPPRPFDPNAGIANDGSIERPPQAAEQVHPERWRHVPPGRIAPGNVLERFLVSSFLSPILFREEDIGFGGGVALTDIDFRGEPYREFANALLTYSEEGQQAYRINWSRWLHYQTLPDGGVLREERGRLFGRLGYEKTLTRRFFGYGSRTSEDGETSYTEELTAVGLGWRDALGAPGGDWLLRSDLQLEHHGLSYGRVRGVPSTGDVAAFADDVAFGDGRTQVWWNSSFAHDTRDSLHQPYSGHRIGVLANLAVMDEGDTGGTVGLEAQQVIPTPPLLHRGGRPSEENPPTDCLAFGAFVVDTLGELPFYSQPSLGGAHTLRSYVENRFTGESACHGSVEYRFGVIPRGHRFTDTIRIERIGLAVFADLGTVADGLGELGDARWHHSYGTGLRIAFSREASFRVDWAFGEEGPNFTIAFGNSF